MLGSQGRGFEPREDASAFHVFKLTIMIVQCNVSILMPVESNLCNIEAEFTLIVNRAMWQLVLIECLSPFHFQKYGPLVGIYIFLKIKPTFTF